MPIEIYLRGVEGLKFKSGEDLEVDNIARKQVETVVNRGCGDQGVVGGGGQVPWQCGDHAGMGAWVRGCVLPANQFLARERAPAIFPQTPRTRLCGARCLPALRQPAIHWR